MNSLQINLISLRQNPASNYPRQRPKRLALALALLAGAFCFGVGGCVGDGYVGVSTYPSYAPYYGYYGYSGVPYYGYGGIYTRNIIVRGQRHPGSFGRHHFWRDRRGGDRSRFSRPSGGRRGNPSIRGGRGDRGRR